MYLLEYFLHKLFSRVKRPEDREKKISDCRRIRLWGRP